MKRIMVFGYHSVGCEGLKALLATGDEIACVVTHRDSPGENLWFDSVADLARDNGLPLRFAEDLSRRTLIETVRETAPDIIYSFYYRNLLPEAVLNVPAMGAYNLHGSLLPRYRGRCPVNWVILRGETKTGLTLHHMVKGADAGDIVGQEEIDIAPDETALSLFRKMIPRAGALIERLHPLIRDGRAPRIPQDPSRATVFPGRRPEDGRIDWKQSAREIDALVRAVTRPYPGAFFLMSGKKTFIWKAMPEASTLDARAGTVLSLDPFRIQTGEGVLRIEEAEFEGGKRWICDGVTLSLDSSPGETVAPGTIL